MKTIKILTLLLLLAACRGERQDPVVLLLLKTTNNPFFQSMEKGVRDAWKEAGNTALDVRAGTKEGDVSAQRQTLETYISKYVTGRKKPLVQAVLLTPSGSEDELTAQIKQLKDSGVFLILIDTKINKNALTRASTDYDVFIGSSNRHGGRMAAGILKRELPKGGAILLLNGVDGQETAFERRAGFLEAINEGGKVKVTVYRITQRTGNWRRAEARSLVDGMLSSGRRFDGIFAANDEMALGAAEAIRHARGTTKPVIVGFDATEEAQTAVKQGVLKATIAQDPYGMGQRAVKSLLALRQGLGVEKDQVIDVKVVDR